MAQSDFASAGRVVSIVNPAAHSAATDLTGLSENTVDTKGFRYAYVSVITGTNAATAEVTLTMQDSDDDSTFADLTGADFVIAATDDDTVKHGLIDTHQTGRYLRIGGSTGTGGAANLAVTVVLWGCANTEQYVDQSSGGADELEFSILST